MKQISIIVMVTVLLACALCGCGEKASEDDSAAQAAKTLTVDEVLSHMETVSEAAGAQKDVTLYETEEGATETEYAYTYFNGEAVATITQKDGTVVEIVGISSPDFFAQLGEGALSMTQVAAAIPAGAVCGDILTRFDEMQEADPDASTYSFDYEGWSLRWESRESEGQEFVQYTATRK